jgi:hypothetical protein
MTLSAKQRWLLLGGLIVATLAAAAWVRDNGGDDTGAVVTAQNRERPEQRPTRSASNPEPQVNLDKLKSRSLGESANDPFAVRTPRAAAPHRAAPAPQVVAAPAPPPPPPSAPPLPFIYMGRLLSTEDVAVFLIHGERNLVVREGDTIDSFYRVERIAESTLTLTYLPLDQHQTMFIGASQ